MENGPFKMILPIKPPFILGILHGYVSHNQRVTTWFTTVYHMISREFTDDSLPNKRHPPKKPCRLTRTELSEGVSFKITRPGKLSQKTMERSTIFSGKMSYKWQCSIVLLNIVKLPEGMFGGTGIIPFYAMKEVYPLDLPVFEEPWQWKLSLITINYQ